jgi:hypothetical protein
VFLHNLVLTIAFTSLVDFSERRLLALAFVSWQEYHTYATSLRRKVQHNIAEQKRRTMFSDWRELTTGAKRDRRDKEVQAERCGRKLCLRLAIHQWIRGVVVSKREREMDDMVAIKWQQVNKWLESTN